MLPDSAPIDVESLLTDAVREALRHEDAYITIGSEEQAWHHREAVRPAWEQTPGALDWLRGAL